jgi:GT2 family glycosyltransferase
VTGWVRAPGKKPSIIATIDGKTCGHVSVAPAGQVMGPAPEGATTFSFPIPRHCQDGKSHVLALALEDGSFIDFPGSHGARTGSLRFRFEAPDHPPGVSATVAPDAEDAPRKPRHVGGADAFTGTTISGWAVDTRSPETAISLHVLVDGEETGAAVCNLPSTAARGHGFSGTTGGFSYAIPDRYLDGSSHVLRLRFDEGAPLAFADGDTELRFTAEAVSSIDGVVDGLTGDIVKGWAVRRNHLSGAVSGGQTVQVLCDGVQVGEVVADQPRPDVAQQLRCDSRVGFQVRLPTECRNGQEFLFSFKVLPEGMDLAGSPLPINYRPLDPRGELRKIAAALDELCVNAFRLQRQLRDFMPVSDATVENYDSWARHYQPELRTHVASQAPLPEDAPLVSVVMPTYRTNLAHLAASVGSVRAQTYRNWELVIADDGSGQPALTALLEGLAAEDSRVRCVFHDRNRGISAATNAALRKTRGAYVVLLDHDDMLSPVALEALLREALRTGARFVYADEDKVDAFGVFSEPNLKPDWNYRLLLGVNYVCHPVMIERKLLRRAGVLRSACDGAQDHDLFLRLAERCRPEQIVHVPEILYHWRKTAQSTAESGQAKPYAVAAGQRAVADHLARRSFCASRVTPVGGSTNYAVSWGFEQQPSVTVIVPFKEQVDTTRRCLDALLANTQWREWRVVLVDNGSESKEAAAFCREARKKPNVVVQRVDEPFNFARLNNLAARAHPAEHYVFLNNDVFIDQKDWLRVLVDETLVDQRVAIVGAKLLYPDRTVQHAGVVLGVGGVADHAFRGLRADEPGYMSRASLAQQYSAVTAACMLCRADVFMDLGGFDEHGLAVAFNDIDLCLKAGRSGWRIVWTPALVAEHHESLSRGDDMAGDKVVRFFRENYEMFQRWQGVLEADPFYNPHFSRERGLFRDLR